MKKLLSKLLSVTLCAAMALTVTSCSSGDSSSSPGSSQPTSDSSQPTADSSTPDKTSGDAVMPVLSINTVSDDKNAIDFVTKPVAPHVSSQIATWTPGYVMPPEPYYEDCTIKLSDTDGTELLSDVLAQVKVRGNWTTTYDKKALRIKFEEKQSVLSMNGGAEAKNWLLFAEYKDASMFRNKTALDIAREILAKDDLYTSDAEFVEVYINGNYWGVYLLCEYQQINENRVNITEAEKDYTGTDIGYFMEFDGYYYNEPELQQFFVDYVDNAPLVPYDGNGGSGKTITCMGRGKKNVGITIKSDIYSQEQRDFIAGFVNGVYTIMYEAAYNDKAYEFNSDYSALVESSLTPREAIEKVVDVNSLADMYLVSELTCDADIYWSSFFMAADFGENGNKKLIFTAPWDFDSAMGNKDRCADGKGFYAANIVPDVNGGEYYTVNPWLAVLMYEDWYVDIIKDKWQTAYSEGVFERAITELESDASSLAPAFDRNYEKWNNIKNNDSFKNELSHGAAKCKTHSEAADYLAQWLKNRVEFMNSQFGN